MKNTDAANGQIKYKKIATLTDTCTTMSFKNKNKNQIKSFFCLRGSIFWPSKHNSKLDYGLQPFKAEVSHSLSSSSK